MEIEASMIESLTLSKVIVSTGKDLFEQITASPAGGTWWFQLKPPVTICGFLVAEVFWWKKSHVTTPITRQWSRGDGFTNRLWTNGNFNFVNSDDSNNFEINENTGVVTLKRMIDRDVLEVPSFDIKIVATEVNQLAKSAVTTSTIIIDDVNDNDPYFDPDGPFNMNVPENTTVGFYIGNVRALDIDLANVIKYEIP